MFLDPRMKLASDEKKERTKVLLLGRVRIDETPGEEKSPDILPCKKKQLYVKLLMIVSVVWLKNIIMQSCLYIIVLFYIPYFNVTCILIIVQTLIIFILDLLYVQNSSCVLLTLTM